MANIFDERLVLGDNIKNYIIYNEHLIRYEIAKQFVKDKKVIDIACGSGYGSFILAKAGAEKVIGADVDAKAVDNANKKYKNNNIKFVVDDAENIKQDDNAFDILVSFETIEHLQNPNKFLSEAKRVVKQDGLAIISTPNKKVSKEKNPFHIKEFDYSEFKDIIKKYFNYYYILEQSNGISSYVVDANNDNKKSQKSISAITNQKDPIYFIALCSQNKINYKLSPAIYSSVNTTALQNLYNNPVLKISDKIYSAIIKVPFIKKLLKS